MRYFAFKADLKARKQCHRFDRYYQCRNLCERCDAIQVRSNEIHPMTYKNMSVSAPYLDTFLDHSSYMERAHRASPWSIIPGWQIDNCPLDWMHLVYLGTARGHIPSVLKLLQNLGRCYEEGESDDLFLRRASIEMRETCKKHRWLACHAVVLLFHVS